MKGSDYAMD